jgi:hypothetical protein
MMPWILVIFLYGDAPLAQIEFKTEKACLTGQEQWRVMNKGFFTPRSTCMFRGA